MSGLNRFPLQSTNREVLINVCEQMHERTAKLLTQRSKAKAAAAMASNCKAAQQITTQELTNLGLLVSIFGEETQTLIGRQGPNSIEFFLAGKKNRLEFPF